MGKPRTSTIPIYDGDDFERIGELRREVEIAERRSQISQASGTARDGDDLPDVDGAKAAYDAFVLEASERAELWELCPIGHEEWRDLLKAHPPRTKPGEDGKDETDPEDAMFNVNVETFGKALLLFVDLEDVDIRTVVAPTLSIELLAKRLKRLSAGEFDTLWVRAYQLNTGGIADPKVSLYSPASRNSVAT